jgi:phage terminase large subunit-like protein
LNSQYDHWREAIRRDLEILKNDFPTVFHVPNIAQERAREAVFKPPYPFIWLNTMANGTGKTNLLAIDLAGTLLGPDYINREWMNCQYYHDIAPLREAGKFRSRITCDAEDIRENGSLWTEIHEWLPTAHFTAKTSAGTFKQLVVPLPHNPNIKNFVDIKTFDQKARAHAGANLHKSWWNEPGPEDVFNETIGRTRSKKGEVGTLVAMFATVLDEAGYLYDLMDDPEFAGRVAHIEGSTWENCAGDELPDEVANQLIKSGVKLTKDEDDHWITRGVLTRQSIENMIATWKKNPAELEARLWGKPMILGGAVWKNMNPMIHVVKNYEPPKKHPVIQVVDPHDAHEDLAAWLTVSPMRHLSAFMEWPNEPWENLFGRRHTIEQTCKIWRDLEAEYDLTDRIIARIGDPNKFLDPDPQTLKTLAQLYAPHGFKFITTVNDDIEYGHRVVEEMFWYDEIIWRSDPADPLARPKFTFTTNVPNLSRCAHRYGWKTNADGSVSSRLNPKYKGGADLIRYAAVAIRTILGSRVEREATGGLTDSERIKRARNPSKYRRENKDFGRRKVVRSVRI